MPATDSFISTATVVSSGSQTFTDVVMGSDDPGRGSTDYSPRGFRVKAYNNRVQITKASSLGGSQSALSLPLTLEDARDLVKSLRKVTT